MNNHKLKFSLVAGKFAVCRLAADAAIPEWALRGALQSVSRSSEELSIVCLAESVPAGIQANAPWSCFKIAGPIPFEQVGVLAAFIRPLAERGISIFAISTFDTDYVLVKDEFTGAAMQALQQAGHKLISGTTRE
jgi:uncharacterized protein